MNRRGFHQYLGGRNSRGKRGLSKMHKGVNSGDVERAFKEVEKMKGGEMSKTKEKPYAGYRTYDAGELKQLNPKANQDRHPNFRDKEGNLFLVRCFCCGDPDRGRENYAIAVARGQCAWCGWKEDKKCSIK